MYRLLVTFFVSFIFNVMNKANTYWYVLFWKHPAVVTHILVQRCVFKRCTEKVENSPSLFFFWSICNFHECCMKYACIYYLIKKIIVLFTWLRDQFQQEGLIGVALYWHYTNVTESFNLENCIIKFLFKLENCIATIF